MMTARDEFMAELGLEEPGLNRVIRAGYRLMNRPARRGESSRGTIPVGTAAPAGSR